MKFKKTVFLPVFMLICGLVSSQGLELNADTAVEMALENNFSIRNEELSLRQKRRSMDNAWNYFLPSVSLSSSLSRSPYAETWSFSAGFSASLNLNVSLMQGMRQTVLNYEAGLLTLETAKRELSRDVRKAFYNLLVLQENMRITRLSLDKAEKLYLQTKANYENGRASRYTMLSAQVSWETMKPSYMEMENSYQQALNNFKQTIGMGIDGELSLSGSIEFEELSLDEKSLIEKYLGNRLDVQTKKKAIEILENSRKASLAALTPSLSLQYTKYPSTTHTSAGGWGDWADRSGSFSIGVSIPVDNLLPWSSERTAIKNTEDQIKQAQMALDQTIKSAELNISNLVRSIDKSRSSLDALNFSVELAEEAYKLAEEAYNAGTKELLDVQDAELALQKARLQVLSGKYTYLTGLLDLEYAINEQLTDSGVR